MSAAAAARRRADLLGGAALGLVTLLLYLATLSRAEWRQELFAKMELFLAEHLGAG